MTRKRLEITDTRPDEFSGRRLARWLKNAAIYGFRAGPVYPLADSPEAPRALAEKMVAVVGCADSWSDRVDHWEIWWCTETGSRIYCLDEVYLSAGIEPLRQFWCDVLARLLEHGARLEREGRIEIKG
jgi:hypothetical protein